MDQRDWDLLDEQLRGANFSRRDDSLTVLTIFAVFFAGIAFGGIVFTHENRPIRLASKIRRLRWRATTMVLAAFGLTRRRRAL